MFLVQDDEFHDFKSYVVVYRVDFRLMATDLNTKSLNPLPLHSKQIVLLLLKDDKPQVFTLMHLGCVWTL